MAPFRREGVHNAGHHHVIVLSFPGVRANVLKGVFGDVVQGEHTIIDEEVPVNALGIRDGDERDPIEFVATKLEFFQHGSKRRGRPIMLDWKRVGSTLVELSVLGRVVIIDVGNGQGRVQSECRRPCNYAPDRWVSCRCHRRVPIM